MPADAGSIARKVSFCGRKSELMQIEQELRKAQNKVFLVGMGGIGKSELAKNTLRGILMSTQPFSGFNSMTVYPPHFVTMEK